MVWGSSHLPSVATEVSGRANHFPRGRKFSFSNDLGGAHLTSFHMHLAGHIVW